MKHVDIYTDGSSSGNPGVGGYGTILVYKGKEKEIHECFDNVTNNQMEIYACIKGLESLKEPCEVDIYTDSQYVVNTMTQGWKRNKNQELWDQLDVLITVHKVNWHWIKGHANNPYNERCDKLAKMR